MGVVTTTMPTSGSDTSISAEATARPPNRSASRVALLPPQIGPESGAFNVSGKACGPGLGLEAGADDPDDLEAIRSSPESDRLTHLRRPFGGLDHRDGGAPVGPVTAGCAALRDRVDEVLELVGEALDAVHRERVGEVLERRRLPLGDPARGRRRDPRGRRRRR